VDRVKLQEKIDALKSENDNANKYLYGLEQEKSKVITQCLIRNGRIIELEERLREE
jgi:hypothetical protein